MRNEIIKRLALPTIDKIIDKIINNGDAQPLKDMCLLAEYFEQKHNCGYVVYWATAGVPRFEVSRVEEYYLAPTWWNCDVHWHTNKSHDWLVKNEPFKENKS